MCQSNNSGAIYSDKAICPDSPLEQFWIETLTDNPKYDVAISFLARDEGISRSLADKLESSGFEVFFFPRNQEELAGTNGMESMRDPFLRSRVNVVMFREPWGKTPWTGVEQTAITDRCLDNGWDALMFVQLDDTSQIPKWIPKTHVRFALNAYGLEQLAGAIKARVQEHGGAIKPLDPMHEARRVKRQAEFSRDRESLMRDRRWIEEQVHKNILSTFAKIQEMIENINAEHDFQIAIGSKGYENCVMRYKFISLGIIWKQPFFNTIMSDQNGECYLSVSVFTGALPIPGRNEMVWETPQQLKEYKLKPEVSETRDLVWVLGKEHIAPTALTDRIVIILMGMIDRANLGTVTRQEF